MVGGASISNRGAVIVMCALPGDARRHLKNFSSPRASARSFPVLLVVLAPTRRLFKCLEDDFYHGSIGATVSPVRIIPRFLFSLSARYALHIQIHERFATWWQMFQRAAKCRSVSLISASFHSEWRTTVWAVCVCVTFVGRPCT